MKFSKLISIHLSYLNRDCLAAPGTLINDSIPTGPVAANANKTKTCYKCQQEGHVSVFFLIAHCQMKLKFFIQIARECPETTDL